MNNIQVSVIGTRGFPLIEGGVEKHCEALYPRIGKSLDVTVYRRRPYVKVQESFAGVVFVDLPSTTVKGFEAILHSFLATCSALKRKPDIVHYHNIGPALFSPLLRLRSIPMVLTYHSPNYEHAKWSGFAKKLLLLSEKVALRNANKIIFVNKFQMQRYSEEVIAKSTYLPNGITEPLFSENSKVLDEFELENGRYILSVGRITPEKGFDVLIKAFDDVGLDGFKLAIVGGVESESGYATELNELAKDLPVVFTGQLHGDGLAQLYEHAALYVLASRNEGFPLALLEAMSFGLDVLVSDIPATHLLSLDPADYCAVDDSVAFTKGMRAKLGSSVKRKYDLDSFDWDQIAQETLAVYDAALNEGSGRSAWLDEDTAC